MPFCLTITTNDRSLGLCIPFMCAIVLARLVFHVLYIVEMFYSTPHHTSRDMSNMKGVIKSERNNGKYR